MAELELVRPTGVLLLGGTAGQALYGTKFRVGEARGHRQPWPEELGGTVTSGYVPDWVVTTSHPSAILRSRNREEDYAAFLQDLRVVRKALAG